jgi:hypothetical protein
MRHGTNTSHINHSLDLVENKFGIEAKNNVVEMEKIKLKRKILGE